MDTLIRTLRPWFRVSKNFMSWEQQEALYLKHTGEVKTTTEWFQIFKIHSHTLFRGRSTPDLNTPLVLVKKGTGWRLREQ